MSDSKTNSYDLIEIDRSAITTTIGSGIEFSGTIRCKTGKTVLISGSFIGDIESNGAVIIEEDGIVRGTIHANKIHLSGIIEKSNDSNEVTADERIVITKTGKLSSKTLSYGELHMDFGSLISANMRPISVDRQQASAPSASPAYEPVSEVHHVASHSQMIQEGISEADQHLIDIDGLDIPSDI